MNKKMKAALAGLAFLAGCEIGIAIQLAKMIHKFTVRESAMEGTIPDDTGAGIPVSGTDEEPEELTGAETDEVPVSGEDEESEELTGEETDEVPVSGMNEEPCFAQ